MIIKILLFTTILIILIITIITVTIMRIMMMTTRSSQLREEGNKAYTSKKNSQALKLYTESVRWVRMMKFFAMTQMAFFGNFSSHCRL